MSCRCEVCQGRPPQTLLYCFDHKRHVHDGHADRNPGHLVVKFDPWPPKRRGTPKRLMMSTGVKLPDSVDLVPYWVNAKYPQPNQGQIGDCTAETMAFDVALMKLKQGIYIAPFSVAFAYAEERIDIGTFPQDSGANMVDEGNALAKHGICFESTMPTSQTSCNKRPSAAAEAEAANFKCDPNQTPIDYRDYQPALFNCQQNPLLGSVRMGYPVPESIQNAVYNGGWVSVPSITESLLGGHSQLEGSYEMLKGPNDKAPRLYVSFLQSWGNTGDMSKGLSLFHFPYPEFFESLWVQAQGGTDNYQQPDLPSGPPGPTISISPTTLQTGDSYTISGSHFTPNTAAVYAATDSTENICPDSRQSVDVDENGSFSTTATMTCTTSGYVQASDSGGQASNEAAFTIGPPQPTDCWTPFLNCLMGWDGSDLNYLLNCLSGLITCLMSQGQTLTKQQGRQILTLISAKLGKTKAPTDCASQLLDCMNGWDGQDFNYLLNCVMGLVTCMVSQGHQLSKRQQQILTLIRKAKAAKTK